jgi:apolipoprotein N-acyltransferase
MSSKNPRRGLNHIAITTRRAETRRETLVIFTLLWNKLKRSKRAWKKHSNKETKSGKRKREENHVIFSENDAVIDEETLEDNNNNFLSELNQLSLNEDDLKADLQELKDIKPGEISE